MIRIKVLNRHGMPANYVRVTILWRDAFGTHSGGHTDSQGFVYFNVGPGAGVIYIDGASDQ